MDWSTDGCLQGSLGWHGITSHHRCTGVGMAGRMGGSAADVRGWLVASNRGDGQPLHVGCREPPNVRCEQLLLHCLSSDCGWDILPTQNDVGWHL